MHYSGDAATNQAIDAQALHLDEPHHHLTMRLFETKKRALDCTHHAEMSTR